MMRKKVLIVAYYWPPAGGPGVQRWLKFATYLPEFGIEPVLFVPQNPSYPIIDEGLCDQVPADLKIIRGKIWEPYGVARLFSSGKTRKMSSGIVPAAKKAGLFEKAALWIRGNIIIPDARVFWVGPAVSRILQIIKEEGIDTIITTGPPHSLHLIGLELQKRARIKWIADFRDPWTSIGYHSSLMLSQFARKRHKQLEHLVLSSADLVIATSRTTRLELVNIGAKNAEVITNGFEPADIDVALDQKFTLAHIGSLLSARNPLILWDALAELAREVKGFADDFQLSLAGTVSSEVVAAIINAGLETQLELTPYLPHQQALQKQRSAQVLLLVEIDSAETRGILPGKLFEYMASGRPMIAIGPRGSEIEDILVETSSGEYFTYGDKARLKEHIASLYERFRTGGLASNAVGTEKYTRRATTSRLAELIGKVWE